jgi:hypothetical protein
VVLLLIRAGWMFGGCWRVGNVVLEATVRVIAARDHELADALRLRNYRSASRQSDRCEGGIGVCCNAFHGSWLCGRARDRGGGQPRRVHVYATGLVRYVHGDG